MKEQTRLIIKKIVPFIMLGVAAMFIIIGVLSLGKQSDYVKTSALVRRVDENVDYSDEGRSVDYTTYVEFEVDGVSYNGKIDLNKSYPEGSMIDILYNPENPADITSVGRTGPIIAIIFGSLVGVLGLVMLYQFFRSLAQSRES